MYFVYRSHYDGPLSKRVHRLPDATVLDWFRRGWTCADPEAWVTAELGGRVYGLASIFEEAREHELPAPESTDQLRALLYEHLYVEGDEDSIRLDDHSLRVLTDDDEVELAYFFLDDETVKSTPDRLAYLFQTWPLPVDAAPAATFDTDVYATVLAPADGGEVSTYAVFLTFYDSESIAWSPPVVLPGTGLADLAGRLRAAEPGDDEEWPVELLLLRALVAPDDRSVEAALRRCNRWPRFATGDDPWPDLPADHGTAHFRAMEILAAGGENGSRRPDRSHLLVGDHLAQLAMHCDEEFGYQQWFLFDTVWAAAHPDLAQSLLTYAYQWDPLED